jgi:hypothetical protein
MDPGRYLRGRAILFLWVLGPLALVCALTAGARLYDESVASARQVGSTLLQFLPDAQARLAATETVLAPLRSGHRNEAEAIADLSVRVNRIAGECGVAVDDLSVTAQRGDAATELAIVFRGRGGVGAVARFLDAVQASERLVALGETQVSLARSLPPWEYSVHVAMRYSLLGD